MPGSVLDIACMLKASTTKHDVIILGIMVEGLKGLGIRVEELGCPKFTCLCSFLGGYSEVLCLCSVPTFGSVI